MSFDEHADGPIDHDDLPATIPYDFEDSNYSTNPPIGQFTSSTTTTTTTTTDAAPHSDSPPTSNSTYHSSLGTFQEYSIGDSYSGSFESSDSSLKAEFKSTDETRRDAQARADRRLFRSNSENMESSIGTKRRKFDLVRSETEIQKKNLNRGYSDLTNIASTRSILPGPTDVRPFRGLIDQKQRYYLEHGINVEGLTASMDSSNISSGETILHLERHKHSYIIPSVDSSLGQCHDNSFSQSDHSSNSLPSNPSVSFSSTDSSSQYNDNNKSTTETAAAETISSDTAPYTTTSAAVDTMATTTSTIDQVESSCPKDDLAFKQGLDMPTNDDSQQPQQHLHDYSPERVDDFAQQISRQKSSTPLRPSHVIESTFPDEDIVNMQQVLHNIEPLHVDDNDSDQDIAPPKNQQSRAPPTLQNIDEISSPFLDQPQQQQQLGRTQSSQTRSSRHTNVLPTINEQIPPPTPSPSSPSVGLSLRRLRSNSDLATVAAAAATTSRTASQYYIMFATTSKYRSSIEKMGATVVSRWDLCTHLVTDDSIPKTTTLLCSLANKKWIVSERWVKDSIAKSRFQDESDYVLIRQSAPNYFANKKLFFRPSANIQRRKAQDLAKASGAKWREKEPDMVKTDSTLIVISSGTPEEVEPYQKAGYETMNREDFLARYGQSDA